MHGWAVGCCKVLLLMVHVAVSIGDTDGTQPHREHNPAPPCPHIPVSPSRSQGPDLLGATLMWTWWDITSHAGMFRCPNLVGLQGVRPGEQRRLSCTSYLLMGLIWPNPCVPCCPLHIHMVPRTPVRRVSEGTERLN